MRAEEPIILTSTKISDLTKTILAYWCVSFFFDLIVLIFVFSVSSNLTQSNKYMGKARGLI